MRPQELGFGHLFESVRDAVIVANATTQRIVLWNQAATDIFGYPTSEALKLRVEDLVPERLKDQHRAGIARYVDTQRGPYVDSREPLELPALRMDGQEIYIEMSLTSIGSAENAVDSERYVAALVRDITQRKQTEQEVRRLNEDLEKRVAERTEQLKVALANLEERERGLQESRQRYRSFIEQSTEGIWRLELVEPVSTRLTPEEQVEQLYRHGYLAECNYAMARMHGYARAEEIVGMRLDELFPHLVQDNVDCLRAFVQSGYQLSEAESQSVGQHGETGYLLNNLTGTVDKGSLLRVWGTQRDVTDTKKNEEAIRQSELLYQTVIEQATENIFLVEVQTRCIAESNPAFQETLGCTEEELRSMTLYDIVAADPKSVDTNIRRVVEQQDPFVGERKYRCKDGSLVDVEVSASILLRHGRETMCVVAHDVTERKRAEEAQRFLIEVGATLSSSLDYRTTLASVARLAVPRLADWCAVDVLEEDGSLNRLEVVHQDPKKIALAHELQERYPPDPTEPRGILGVVRSGRSEFHAEIADSMLVAVARDEEHLRLMREIGFRSVIIVPLVARGRTLGAVTLVSAESGRRYGSADLELAKELARRAALAVDNARLYRGRSEIARTLQAGLLPTSLPEIPGIEVGLCYLPVGEVDVGGDFYDLFEHSTVDQEGSVEPSPSWGVLIGDVSGKGAEAAAILALARYTIRTLAMHQTAPSAVLAGLNKAMLRQRHDYKFCTATYAKLETGEGDGKRNAKITVSRGGHPPPILLKADESLHRIGNSGRVIGVFEDPNLTEQEVPLLPGDAVVFYTDGVIEARSSSGLFFGEERLMSLLRGCVDLDASSIAGRIEDATLDFQDSGPRDDIAVLVLRLSK